MRFAITLSDRYLKVLRNFIERGWTPLKIFTTTMDGRIHRNTGVIDFARSLKVEVQISRLSAQNLRELSERGCDALVLASYSWRIGDWRPHLKYAVNFHPAPLPHGRGPSPLPVPILEQASSWGVACHKVEHEFDSGDVLRRIEFPVCAGDDYDSIDLRTQFAAAQLSAEVAEHFVEYWNGATKQTAGSYYPQWTHEQRRLVFSQTVEQNLRRIRAFGPLECIAQLNNATLFVRRAVGWVQPHRIAAGSVVHANGLALVVAVADGYLGLTEWSLISADAVTGPLRR